MMDSLSAGPSSSHVKRIKLDTNEIGELAETLKEDDLDNRNEPAFGFVIDKPKHMNAECLTSDVGFHKLVTEKYFVDKTGFIEEVLSIASWALAFFRPRCFMKTTHLKSLIMYCDFASDNAIASSLFSKLKVGIMEDHFQSYCVLFVPLNGLLRNEANEVGRSFKKYVIENLRSYCKKHDDNFTSHDFERIRHELDECEDYVFIHEVCYVLKQKFHKKVILLLDNIDVLFQLFEPKKVEIALKNFFNLLISDRPVYLFKLIMTGTVFQSIFSKTSSFGGGIRVDVAHGIHSMDQYFMFSEDEVKNLCTRFSYPVESSITELRKRYGGYTMTNCESSMYNSFSVTQFFRHYPTFSSTVFECVEIMWNSYHSRDPLYCTENIMISKAEQWIWKRMLKNEHVLDKCKTDRLAKLDFSEFIYNFSAGIHFLMYGGYLTPTENRIQDITVCIPNLEVRKIFEDRRTTFLSEPLTTAQLEVWNNEFNNCTENYHSFCDLLNRTLIKASNRTFSNEAAYRALLFMILHCNPAYKTHDELESGYGFPDIILFPKRNQIPIVIEIGHLKADEFTDENKPERIQRLLTMKYNQVIKKPYGCVLQEYSNEMNILLFVGCQKMLYSGLYQNVAIP